MILLDEMQKEMAEFFKDFYAGAEQQRHSVFAALAGTGARLEFGPCEGEIKLPGNWPLDQFDEWNRRNWELAGGQ